MKVLCSGSYKGTGKFNYDIMNYDKKIFYVMDGATPVYFDNKFFNTSDLYEYMQFIKKNVSNKGSIVDIIKNSIIESNREIDGYNKYPNYELPTFTIGFIKEFSDRLDYYVLCDVLIAIKFKDGSIKCIIDDRINKIKELHIQKRDDILKKNVSSTMKNKLLEDCEQYIRSFSNNENGFYVGSTDPIYIDKGIIGSLNKNEVDKILICSDGLINTYKEEISDDYFDVDKLNNIVNSILSKDKRDDLSFILLGSV